MKVEIITDESGNKRYIQKWTWDSSLPKLMHIGLHPIKDELNENPSAKRAIDFAKHWGYGTLIMCNLYSQIVESFGQLEIDSSFEENASHILFQAKKCEEILFAWGKSEIALPRAKQLTWLLSDFKIITVGFNSDGRPMRAFQVSPSFDKVRFPIRREQN